MSTVFRLATILDVAEIHALQSASEADVNKFLGWPEREINPDYYRRRLKNQDRGIGNKRMYALERGGRILAIVSVSPSAPSFWGRKAFADPRAKPLCVFDVAVWPEFQRQGIGTALMLEVERLALCQGFRFVRLDAFADNSRSNDFYRKIGYVERRRCEVKGYKLVCYEKDLLIP